MCAHGRSKCALVLDKRRQMRMMTTMLCLLIIMIGNVYERRRLEEKVVN